MSSSWNPRGRPAGNVVEEIDLTLSDSPEPQSKPPPPPPPPGPRSIPRTSIKPVQRKPTLPTRVKSETTTATAPSRTQAKQPVPRISISHVAGIINTTDENVLRQVLINLCRTSPALSGAVVRGLATHSSFAQNLIRRHARGISQRPQRSQVKVERRVKAERETSPSGRSDSPINIVSSPDFARFVKNEQQASPAQSDSCSSAAFSNPPPVSFPKTPEHGRGHSSFSNPTGNPSKQPVKSETSLPRESKNPAQSSTASTTSTERKPTFEVCKNCEHQFLEGVNDTCFYHPGRKQTRTDITGRRITQYSCCEGQEWEAPCEMGVHIASSVSGLDKLKQSGSPLQNRPLKRPKFL